MKVLRNLFALFILCTITFEKGYTQCTEVASCSPGTATSASNGFKGGIYGVTLGTISTTSSGDTAGYQNFYCTDSTELNLGQEYNIQITTGTSIAEAIKIWVDLNNDNIISDPGELIYENSGTLTNHSGTLVIPVGATMDTPLRMRISSEWDGSSSPIEPCSTPEYGQVEDYKVIVRPNPNPPTTAFTVDQTVTCDGMVQFTDESANIPTEWKWLFGDGDSSVFPNPSHTYDTSGTYTVTLVTSNSNGLDTLIKTNYITYNDATPVTSTCMSGVSSYCCGYGILGVTFGTIDQASEDASVGYEDFTCYNSTSLMEGMNHSITIATSATLKQDFNIYLDLNNDGTLDESTERIGRFTGETNPTNSFRIPSNSLKNVPLRLRICADHEGSLINACGTLTNGQCEDYTVVVVENTNPPVANFVVDQRDRCDSMFIFENISQNNIDSVIWDFGDGTISNEINPIHYYPDEGIYDITLTVFNEYGSDDISRSNYITRRTHPKRLCAVSSSSPNWFDVGIQNVIFAGIFNNTGNDENSYKDFSCTQTATVLPKSTNQISVLTEGQEQVVVYIDWNNDGVIEPFSETAFQMVNYISHDGFVIVPDSAVKDTKLRMRVMSQEVDGPNQITSACQNINAGEIEDYSIIVEGPESVHERIANSINVYPNPSEGIFNIESKNFTLDIVEVYNILGERVLVMDNSGALHNRVLNLGEFGSGMYLVRIQTGEYHVTKQLIVK